MIRVHDVRKEFLLSHSGAGSLKSALLWWKRRQLEHFVALDGVSFEVAAGDSVALIGKNGAGKSTMLSLLARIYKPTSGTIEIQGRIAPTSQASRTFFSTA